MRAAVASARVVGAAGRRRTAIARIPPCGTALSVVRPLAWRHARLCGSPARLFTNASEAQTAEATNDTAANDGGNADEETPTPTGPRTLWSATSLKGQFDAAEQTIGRAAVVAGSGLGLALLGIAPFTAPTPFVAALLLATLQVRIAHMWQTRQLRAQLRRHVTELVEIEEASTLSVVFDGGLSRTIHLTQASSGETRMSLEELFRCGNPIMFLDPALGGSSEEEALDSLRSSEKVIREEELAVSRFEEESQDEAERMVQRLTNLKAGDLQKLGQSVTGGPTPRASMEQIARSSQIVAAVILLLGTLMCLSGRLSDHAAVPAASTSGAGRSSGQE